MPRRATLFVAAAILSAGLTMAAEDASVKCPEGYVCVPVKEMAARTASIWNLRAENAELRSELSRLRPRFVSLWATAGVEYLPTLGETKPYGLGGVTIGGRLNAWAGLFGDTGAVGLGWTW